MKLSELRDNQALRPLAIVVAILLGVLYVTVRYLPSYILRIELGEVTLRVMGYQTSIETCIRMRRYRTGDPVTQCGPDQKIVPANLLPEQPGVLHSLEVASNGQITIILDDFGIRPAFGFTCVLTPVPHTDSAPSWNGNTDCQDSGLGPFLFEYDPDVPVIGGPKESWRP